MLAFAATYKFGEQFAQVLTMTFFKREIGFSNTEVGLASKSVGFVAWLVGGAVGGTLVARFGVRKMIVAFGVLQASTHLAYLMIAFAGHDLQVFAAAIFIENMSFAMATSAFVAALMSVCSPAVSATQFALLTSLSSVGERVFGVFAADVVDAISGYKGLLRVDDRDVAAGDRARLVRDQAHARAGAVARAAAARQARHGSCPLRRGSVA